VTTTTTGPLRRLLALSRPQLPRLTLAAAIGAAASLAAVGLTATSAWLISRAAEQPPVLTLMVAIVAVRALGIGRGVLRYGERLLAHDAALRVLSGVRVRCYEAVERLAPAAAPLRNGDLTARFVSDVDGVPDALIRGVLPITGAALTGAAGVGLLAWLAPPAALALLAGILVATVLVPALHAAIAARAEASRAPLRGELAEGTVDLLTGLDTYVAYGAADERVGTLLDTDRRLARAERRSGWAAAATEALLLLTAGATVWAILLLGAHRVHTGALDPVLLAVLVLTPMALFEVLGMVPEAVRRLSTSRTTLARVFEVLDASPPVAEPTSAGAVPPGPHTLRLESMTAGWPGGPDILTAIDLELTPGRRVAVVGASGAGKSTLAAVLLRFLEPHAGSYRIGGIDVRALRTDDVRRIVGTCGQNAYLFDSTIRANLLISCPEADDDRLWAALDRARIGDWVRRLPLGLGTSVGAGGTRVSGGQARRLTLARTLLADPQIVVLDEPTEHLDPDTADALTADLLAATADRTTLLITHRLAGLDAVDEVIVLDAGRVVQRGTHAQLVDRPGPYRQLWQHERGALRPTGLTESQSMQPTPGADTKEEQP
jgi:thiol reductant ABC exporter CydC subunit